MWLNVFLKIGIDAYFPGKYYSKMFCTSHTRIKMCTLSACTYTYIILKLFNFTICINKQKINVLITLNFCSNCQRKFNKWRNCLSSTSFVKYISLFELWLFSCLLLKLMMSTEIKNITLIYIQIWYWFYLMVFYLISKNYFILKYYFRHR